MFQFRNTNTLKTSLSDSLRKEESSLALQGFTLDADQEQIRRLIGKAFAGSTEKGGGEPFLHWATSHHKFASQDEREQFFRFIMSYPFLEDLSGNSFQLSSQPQQQQQQLAPDNTILSVVTVQEFDPAVHAAKQASLFYKIQKYWAMMTTTLQIIFQLKEKTPPLFEDKKHKEDLKIFTEKTQEWEQEYVKWHIQYGPDDTHWYVHMVACNPQFQGQGKGKELMTKLCQLADHRGQAMYLEAGEPNRRFYEKFGFVVKHTAVFSDPQVVDAADAKPFEMHLMTRPSGTSSAAPNT